MYTVMLTSPVNGSGRTTLAAAFAMHAEETAKGITVSLDADIDHELLNWSLRSNLSRTIIGAWDESCTLENLQNLEAEGVELILVDSDISDQNACVETVLPLADLVIVIVRPRSEDLDSIGKLIDLLESEEKTFFFIINQATEDEDMNTAAILSLAQYGTVAPVVLPLCPELGFLKQSVDPDLQGNDNVLNIEIPKLWDYLHKNMDPVSDEPVLRYETEPFAPSPKRTTTPYGYEATFLVPEMVYPCKIIEISAEGLLFSSEIKIPEGFRLRFNLPYIGQMDCEVVTGESEYLTARFLISKQRQAELVEQVDQLVRASRESPDAIEEMAYAS